MNQETFPSVERCKRAVFGANSEYVVSGPVGLRGGYRWPRCCLTVIQHPNDGFPMVATAAHVIYADHKTGRPAPLAILPDTLRDHYKLQHGGLPRYDQILHQDHMLVLPDRGTPRHNCEGFKTADVDPSKPVYLAERDVNGRLEVWRGRFVGWLGLMGSVDLDGVSVLVEKGDSGSAMLQMYGTEPHCVGVFLGFAEGDESRQRLLFGTVPDDYLQKDGPTRHMTMAERVKAFWAEREG